MVGVAVAVLYDDDNKETDMKEVTLAGHKVRLYQSIEELPMQRFHRYNKYLLVDAGVGSDIQDFDNHIERVVRYIKNGERDNAAKELENMRMNVYLILQEQGVRDMSFACLVESIDGKPCDDLSEEGLRETLRTLGGVPRKDVASELGATKKKIDTELATYFPDIFDDVTTREYYDMMKNRTQAVLQEIITGEKHQQEIDELTEKLILYVKPHCFNGKDSAEVQHDKNYESLCLTIQKNTGADPRTMTVLSFYTAYEYVRKMANEAKKSVAGRR